MSDIGEIPLTEKDIGKTTSEFDTQRDWKVTVAQHKAYELSWAKNIVGRRIDFPRKDGKLVWGIEIEIPLRFEGKIENIYSDLSKQLSEEKDIKITDEEIQQEIEKKKGRTWFHDIDKIGLPKNIKRIRIIDLAPQEILPKKQRNIDSKRNFWHSKHRAIKLTRPQGSSLVDRAMLNLAMSPKSSIKRSEVLQDLFYDTFADNKEAISKFRKTLEDSGAEEILVIHAHGGTDQVIGEQTTAVKGKDAEFQTKGNRISLTEVIERYDDPGKYAAIIVNSCYMGKDKLAGGKVAVFRPQGKTGGGHPVRNPFPGKNKTMISEAKN